MKPKFSVLPLWQGFTPGDSDIKVRPFLIAAIIRETLIKATLPGFFVREAATPKFASS
ncbi:hypothetical protein [Methyloversatilis universalis]|jgi:hypothetical protein|uniref:hypothetical protein n=1 Tax=Methyloversatilis universalis TaxID=378211 RepID=UPI0012F7C63E|nr:hypothetical protein [Methyloversatilis universalis]